MKENRKKIKITDICDIQVGKTPARNNPRFWGDGNKWLSIADMNQGRELENTKETITDEAVKETNCKLIDKGTVLFSFKLSIGKVGITKIPMYTNEAIAAFIIKDKNKLLNKFLYYYLISKDFSIGSNKAVMGNTLNKKILESFMIPLPTLSEQKAIVKKLDQAYSLINKRTESIELLDEYLRSVFLDMFGDPISNPKGWKVMRFDELGSLDRGKSKHRPRNAPELLGGIHPLIQTGDVSNAGVYIENYTSTYSDIGLAQSKKWPKGTLCITIAANIAKTGILDFDACFPDSVVGFVPNNDLTNNEFILFWLSFLQESLEAMAPESAQKNINLRILRELMVVVPPLNLQNKFAEKVRKSEMVRKSMQKQLLLLNDNFQMQLSTL